MTKTKKLIWYSIIGIFILVQLYPSSRPEVTMDNPNDLFKATEVPVEVASMLKAACYDCHSNESVYPWYTSIAPVKWLIYRDINVGREELNFSDWASMSKMDMAGALDEISGAVLDGEMPMKIYPLTHPDAKLSEEDRQLIGDWANNYMEALFE